MGEPEAAGTAPAPQQTEPPPPPEAQPRLPAKPVRGGGGDSQPQPQAPPVALSPATPAPPQAQPGALGLQPQQVQPETGTSVQPGAPAQWPARPVRGQEAAQTNVKKKAPDLGSFYMTPAEVGERDLARAKPLQDYLTTQADILESHKAKAQEQLKVIEYQHLERMKAIEQTAKLLASERNRNNLTADEKKTRDVAKALWMREHPGEEPSDEQLATRINQKLTEDADLERKKKEEGLQSTLLGITRAMLKINEEREKPQQAQDLAEAIRQHRMDPGMQGLPRDLQAKVKDELARSGFNLAEAELEFSATKRKLATMNSSTQTGLRNSLLALQGFLPQVEDAYTAWQKTKLPGGYQLYNKAALMVARNSKDPAISAPAQNLLTQITDVQESIAKVYMGTASPTDKSLALAQKQLQGEWNPAVFAQALATLKRASETRLRIMESPNVAGVSADNPYEPPQGNQDNDPMKIR